MSAGDKARIALPGGQDRLRDAILYVSDSCQSAPRFGQVKLNKIIWRADFRAFADRGVPVTGRAYQRLPQGPALVEMKPVQREMAEAGLIRVETQDLGSGFVEERVIPLVPVRTNYLSRSDLSYLDEAIVHYWDKTAREASDESHGVAWLTHRNKQRFSYLAALLSDEEPGGEQLHRLEVLGQRRRWQSA